MRDKDKNFFESLMSFIPLGKENAIPQKCLADMLGIQTSVLRNWFLMARMNGYFILGDQNGYYRPETLSEMNDYYQYMYSGAMTRLKSLKPLRDTLRSYGIEKPENGIPLFCDGTELVPDKNVREISKKKKPYQTCFIFFTDDAFEEKLEDEEE